MSIQKPQFACYLSTRNGGNILYAEGSTAWLYDCPLFLSTLYEAYKGFEHIPINCQDTLVYIDPITR